MPAISYKESDKTINLKYLPRWPPINIKFRDLSYSVPYRGGKKSILSDISGEFQSGQVTAILGPSGAGKSTLLNVLAGFKTSKASDDVLVNGRPRCMKTFRKMSRYIMQGDLHQPHLTVQEAMMVAANLKLGNHLTKLQKNEVIDQILDLLRLTKTTETMCQLLSGGEMKRLSIALELVDNPPVIFLDEPTTGLDALSSSQCISLLRQIALGGRTVVCSIHTPSAKIFEMFDLVYAMAGWTLDSIILNCVRCIYHYTGRKCSTQHHDALHTGGQCVYQGNPAQIIPFMEKVGVACPLTYNPADFIVEVSCGDYGYEYIDRMVVEVENGRCRRWPFQAKEKPLEEKLPEDFDPKQLKCRSTSWDQFKVLHNRRWKQMWRDSRYIKLQVYATFCVAALVGCFFQGCGIDATKALFNIRFHITVLIMSMVIPMITMLVRFPGEVGLLKREHFNRWFKLAPFYWSLVLASAPVQIGLPLIYVAVTYPMSSQPLELMRFYRFSAITIMISLISGSFGLIISSRFRLINGVFVGTAFLIAPSIMLPTSTIGYQKGAELPLYLVILRNLSHLRFGLEGLFEAIYGYDRADTICPHNEVFCLFAKAGYLKNVLGFHEANYSVSMVVLWLYLIFSTTMAYFMIKMRLAFSAYA